MAIKRITINECQNHHVQWGETHPAHPLTLFSQITYGRYGSQPKSPQRISTATPKACPTQLVCIILPIIFRTAAVVWPLKSVPAGSPILRVTRAKEPEQNNFHIAAMICYRSFGNKSDFVPEMHSCRKDTHKRALLAKAHAQCPCKRLSSWLPMLGLNHPPSAGTSLAMAFKQATVSELTHVVEYDCGMQWWWSCSLGSRRSR